MFPITSLMWIGMMMLRQKVFYKHSFDDNTLKIKYHLRNIDQVDEQLIKNINYFGD